MASYMHVDLNRVEWLQYTDKGRYSPPIIVGDLVMSMVDFEKGYSPPLHTHEDDQISLCLSGVLEIDLEEDGVQRYEYLRPGQALAIKPYIPHRLIGVEKGRTLEIWSPGLRHRAAATRFVCGESPIRVPDLLSTVEQIMGVTNSNGHTPEAASTIVREGPGHTVGGPKGGK